MKFNWHPTDFKDVVRIVTSPPGQILQAVTQAIGRMGALPCPSPAWDPHGTYRVGLEHGLPAIQRLDGTTNSWVRANMQAPTTRMQIVAAQPGQRVRVRVGDRVLDATILQVDESTFPGKVVVEDDQGQRHEVPINIGWPTP